MYLVEPQSVEELKQLAHTHFAEIQGLGSAPGQGQGLRSTDRCDSDSVSVSFVSEKITTAVSGKKGTCYYPFQQGGVTVRLRPVKEIRDVSCSVMSCHAHAHGCLAPFSILLLLHSVTP